MKVSAEKVSGSKVVLTVEAPTNVVDEALEKAYKSVVKRVNVPGFRRGKAPRFILERHFGKEILYEDAMKEVLPAQYEEAVNETAIQPVDDPEFDDVHFKQGEPLTFKATVSVMPEVALEDYSDVSVAYETPTVTEEDVDQQVNYLRDRMAELRPLEEDAALEAGDFASCHVKGIEGGTFKAEIDRELSYVGVGKENPLVPGLGDALIGMKKGETKEFSGTYPAEPSGDAEKNQTEDEKAENAKAEKEQVAQAGDPEKPAKKTRSKKKAAAEEAPAEATPAEPPKEARFQVEIKDCHRKYPVSDEDFLKNLSKATMDEVREDLKVRILAMKTDSAKRAHADKVDEALLSKATVEIPKVLILRKQQELFDSFVERLSGSTANPEVFFPRGKESAEQLFQSFAPQAEKEVKRELVLSKIAAKEGIKVSEEAVNKVVQAIAGEMGKDVSAVKTTLGLRGALAGIEQSLLRVEALKKLAIDAATRAGTPLPEDKPVEVADGTEATASAGADSAPSEGDSTPSGTAPAPSGAGSAPSEASSEVPAAPAHEQAEIDKVPE